MALESFWVLAQRFMIRNVLSPYEFCSRFERQEFARKSTAGVPLYDRLDLDGLAPYLGHTPESVRMTVPAAWEIGIRDGTLPPLKICVECAEQGYHTALFETGWLDICPIHNRMLWAKCPWCKRKLRHVSWRRFGAIPGSLPCGHAWSGVSIRRAPSIDPKSARRFAAWVQRVRARSSEETWYAISLHGTGCLQQDNRDFGELTQLLGVMGGLGGEIEPHLSFHIPHFKHGRVRRTLASRLRSDWFDATLQRLSRYMGGMSTKPWQEQIGHIHRTYEAYLNLRRLGPRRLVEWVTKRLCLLPLHGRLISRPLLDAQILNALGCALLQKHVTSSTYPQEVATSPQDYFDFMCRYSGAPLGLLRIRGVDTSVQWMPMELTPSRLEQRAKDRGRVE